MFHLSLGFFDDLARVTINEGAFYPMNETSTLAALLEKAAARHNNASGRRLAELAQNAGHDVSHATLNRIRKGTYKSDPSPGTIRAIAYLAGVPEATAFAAAATGTSRSPEAVFNEWADLQSKSLLLVLEYSRLRGIDPAKAREEMMDVLMMAQQLKDGRPWTPPWAPSGTFKPGDEPWRESWWHRPSTVREVDASELLGDDAPTGATFYRVGIPGWERPDETQQTGVGNGRTEEVTEPRTEAGGTVDSSEAGGDRSRSGAPMKRIRKAANPLGTAARNVKRGKAQDLNPDDQGSEADDFELAAMEGETAELRRRRLEGEPWDQPDPDGPEDGA